MAFSTLPIQHFHGDTSSNNRLHLKSTDDNAVEGEEVVEQPPIFLLPGMDSTRRTILLQTVSAIFLLSVSTPANAGIDPASLRKLPVAGDTSGSLSQLRQIQGQNIESSSGPQPDDSKDIAFTLLPNGASYRDYREGKGDVTIQHGSKVAVELTIRCKSFATADEPGGLKYYSTKQDTDFNELAWTISSSDNSSFDSPVPAELEECMIGMKRGAIRRIELPSMIVYRARKEGRLPLPSEKNKDGKRRFENLFKTDATLLFEVLVTRIK
jgi:hypothetical protein